MTPPDLPDFTDDYELVDFAPEPNERAEFWTGFIVGGFWVGFWWAVTEGIRCALASRAVRNFFAS